MDASSCLYEDDVDYSLSPPPTPPSLASSVDFVDAFTQVLSTPNILLDDDADDTYGGGASDPAASPAMFRRNLEQEFLSFSPGDWTDPRCLRFEECSDCHERIRFSDNIARVASRGLLDSRVRCDECHSRHEIDLRSPEPPLAAQNFMVHVNLGQAAQKQFEFLNGFVGGFNTLSCTIKPSVWDFSTTLKREETRNKGFQRRKSPPIKGSCKSPPVRVVGFQTAEPIDSSSPSPPKKRRS